MPGVPLCLQAGPACPPCRAMRARATSRCTATISARPRTVELQLAPRIFKAVPDRNSANPHGAGCGKRLVSPRSPGDSTMPSGADLSTILNRILDAAADNLRIAKILIQMGLDPDNITYDAIFNRLLEIVLANITLANMLGLVGAIFFVATLLMQTMVPLRIANMVGCAFFVGFGALAGNVTTFLLYLLLLPINAIRLR